uniref:Uncharacterized protein n=1 Tax=Arundo donax TaxID=35708 RepID=A0A0A9B887_ARUDO
MNGTKPYLESNITPKGNEAGGSHKPYPPEPPSGHQESYDTEKVPSNILTTPVLVGRGGVRKEQRTFDSDRTDKNNFAYVDRLIGSRTRE